MRAYFLHLDQLTKRMLSLLHGSREFNSTARYDVDSWFQLDCIDSQPRSMSVNILQPSLLLTK